MTIINPNSIAGITSVTAQADIINFYKSDGNQAGLGLNGVNFNTTAGISTFNNLVVGGTLTYEDVKNVDAIGIITAREGIFLPDNKKVQLGNVAGTADFEIAHDTTNTVLQNRTGALYLKGIGGSGNNIIIEAKNNENSARFIPDGAVELYHNNSLKVSTTASGARVHDQLQVDGTIFAAVGLKVNVDNQKIRLGASDDLEIYHDSSHSILKNSTGYLRLMAGGSGVTISNGDNSETMAAFVKDGAVDLYHNNSKKLETTSDGVKFTGVEYLTEGTIYLEKGGAHHHRILINDQGNDLALQQSSDSGANTNFTSYLRMKDGGDIWLPVDGKKLLLGAGNDLEIYHSGSHTFINNATGALTISGDDLNFENAARNEKYIECDNGGSVNLYHNNSRKFSTYSSGVEITGTLWIPDGSASGNRISVGNSGDLLIYHDGNNSFIKDTGTGRLTIATSQLQLTNAADSAVMIKATESDAVELYYNGSKKFETKSDGATISGHLYTGTNKIITSGWGAITAPENQGYEINSIGSPNKYMIQAKGGSSVYLYFNGDKKFETRSDGIKVTGDIQLDGANGTDLKIKTSNAAGIIYQADENGHDFQTWSNSAWRTGLHVADSGQVTKPRTPHFAANGSPSIGTNNGINYVASQFGNVPDNTGSHYSNSTGRFTAPVAGKYLFGGALWCSNGDDSSGNHLLVFKKNGSEAGFGSNHRHNKNQLHATMCIGLNANDYITLGFADGSGGSIQGSTPRNYFWGYLVG